MMMQFTKIIHNNVLRVVCALGRHDMIWRYIRLMYDGCVLLSVLVMHRVFCFLHYMFNVCEFTVIYDLLWLCVVCVIGYGNALYIVVMFDMLILMYVA